MTIACLVSFLVIDNLLTRRGVYIMQLQCYAIDEYFNKKVE